MLALPAAADLRERISQVHGLALARSLLALGMGLETGLGTRVSLARRTAVRGAQPQEVSLFRRQPVDEGVAAVLIATSDPSP